MIETVSNQLAPGSNSRSQLGWVIVSGLLIGTFFSLFVVPVAYTFLSRRCGLGVNGGDSEA